MTDRTIAIGDIHGCSIALETLLDEIQPRPNDLIIQLGDVIDRGPNSSKAVERLIAVVLMGCSPQSSGRAAMRRR